MSEFDFFGDAETSDSGHLDAAGHDHAGLDFAGHVDGDVEWTGHEDSGYEPLDGAYPHAEGDLATDGEITAEADLDGEWGAADGGVLDGLDFAFDSVDITTLSDVDFDASYDLIGSAPDENGWWADLAADDNHDAAYDVVSYDDLGASAYVTR